MIFELVVIILVGFSARADDRRIEVDCKVSVECVIVEGACGEPHVVNKKYRDRKELRIKNYSDVISCKAIKADRIENYEAFCDDGTCRLKTKIQEKQ